MGLSVIRQLVQNRVAWIVAGISFAVAIAAATFAFFALEFAQQRDNDVLAAIDTVYDIHASNVTLLVDGLKNLQDGDAEVGYQYLELLLRSRVSYLESLEEPHPEVVVDALAKAREYFEAYEAGP